MQLMEVDQGKKEEGGVAFFFPRSFFFFLSFLLLQEVKHSLLQHGQVSKWNLFSRAPAEAFLVLSPTKFETRGNCGGRGRGGGNVLQVGGEFYATGPWRWVRMTTCVWWRMGSKLVMMMDDATGMRYLDWVGNRNCGSKSY